MTPHQVLSDLKSKIPATTSLKNALETFIKHFDNTKVDGCDKSNDGDMLLFQWGGPSSLDPYFSISLTRQFSHVDEDGEYLGMQQLHMICRFVIDETSIASGNEWFDGTDIDLFIKQVLSSKAVSATTSLKMRSLAFELDNV